MCDCGWDKRADVEFSTLRGERDVARADAMEAEGNTRNAEDRCRVLIRANSKLRVDLAVERREVARLDERLAKLMADAAFKARRLDALVAQLEEQGK
jgi:hypothetical protein